MYTHTHINYKKGWKLDGHNDTNSTINQIMHPDTEASSIQARNLTHSCVNMSPFACLRLSESRNSFSIGTATSVTCFNAINSIFNLLNSFFGLREGILEFAVAAKITFFE